ncbi:MAG: hypothetical protein IJ097_00740 [Bacilli bacterium]|nr:hypothetical protein [Bacilli bacterium]
MGKYNLGKSNIVVQNKVNKEELFVNEVKADVIVKDINRQLDGISNSLHKINNILNRTVKIELVKGSKANTFKSWAKKAKSQSDNSIKLKEKFNSKYEQDVKDYPIKLLDERIAELERKIANMSN